MFIDSLYLNECCTPPQRSAELREQSDLHSLTEQERPRSQGLHKFHLGGTEGQEFNVYIMQLRELNSIRGSSDLYLFPAPLAVSDLYYTAACLCLCAVEPTGPDAIIDFARLCGLLCASVALFYVFFVS